MQDDAPDRTGTAQRSGPLADVRVIDLTTMVMGPYCTQIMADMGADVIKVEPPGGELTRRLLADDPRNSLHGMGAYFITLNRNKKSVAIDLKHDDGVEANRNRDERDDA